jgi:hypothetical protein
VIIFRDGYILGQAIHKLLLSRSQLENSGVLMTPLAERLTFGHHDS